LPEAARPAQIHELNIRCRLTVTGGININFSIRAKMKFSSDKTTNILFYFNSLVILFSIRKFLNTKLKMSSSDRRRRGVVKILSFRRVGGRALRRTRPRSNGHDSSAEARVGNDIATVCSGFESVHPNA